MKKILLLSILFISSLGTVFAIPPGSYVDKRGNLVFIVNNNGKEVYLIGKDGKVLLTQYVVSEQYDNDADATKVVLKTKGLTGQNVIYYREKSNGEVEIDDGLRVLHRE